MCFPETRWGNTGATRAFTVPWAAAKRRLADEYDAAQERGDVGKRGDYGVVSSDREHTPATSTDLGLSRKAIHDARQVRDAEQAEPGIVKATVDAAVDAGEEPTKTKVRKAVSEVNHPHASATVS